MCLRVLVRGKVQGVGYRNFARREAARLSVAGHAVNRPDGCVEVLACGETSAVNAFVAKLIEGPPWSAVSAVQPEPAACTGPGFTTG